MKRRKYLLAGTVIGLLTGGAGTVHAKPTKASSKDAQIELLTRRLELLEKRLEERAAVQKPAAPVASDGTSDTKQLQRKFRVLERKVEINNEIALENAKKTPKLEAGASGFKITSPDGEHQLRLRGYAQADGRFFMDDTAGNVTDTFTLRRARLNIDGTLWKYNDFRIAPDFAGSSPSLFDAYLDLHYFPFASLNVGKQKPAIGLERLQSATALAFAERAYPTQLQPSRDIGVLLHGEFAKPGYTTQYGGPHNFNDFITYQVGVFNGGADNQSPTNSTSASFDNKAFEGRIFAHPFQHSGISLLEGLGLGVGGSWADPNYQPLPSLVSPGQANIVTYLAGAAAVNERYRIYPQFYWYTGPFGLMGEYVRSSQELNAGRTSSANNITQDNWAYQVAASYVVTGEDNTFRGVKPRQGFDPFKGNWGALQLAARWSELDIDDATFKNFGTASKPVYLYANPTKSVSKASSWAVGANWWLNQNVKLMANYEQTHFAGGASTGPRITNRETEKAFFTRFQLAF